MHIFHFQFAIQYNVPNCSGTGSSIRQVYLVNSVWLSNPLCIPRKLWPHSLSGSPPYIPRMHQKHPTSCSSKYLFFRNCQLAGKIEEQLKIDSQINLFFFKLFTFTMLAYNHYTNCHCMPHWDQWWHRSILVVHFIYGPFWASWLASEEQLFEQIKCLFLKINHFCCD